MARFSSPVVLNMYTTPNSLSQLGRLSKPMFSKALHALLILGLQGPIAHSSSLEVHLQFWQASFSNVLPISSNSCVRMTLPS